MSEENKLHSALDEENDKDNDNITSGEAEEAAKPEEHEQNKDAEVLDGDENSKESDGVEGGAAEEISEEANEATATENEGGIAEDEPEDISGSDESLVKERYFSLLTSYNDLSERYAEEAAKNNSTTMMTFSAILSATSILLLLAVFLSFAFGLIPGRGPVTLYQVPAGQLASEETVDQALMLEEFKNSVVVINTKKSTGSGTGTGIIISSDGYIVTNYHVVDNVSSIYVTLYKESKSEKATLIGYSQRDDIAVIKIDRDSLRPAVFARSENCLVGENVYAVGSPEGEEYAWSVTKGIISAVDREIKIYDDEGILEKKMYLIQTDTSVNPGNSGGPLINSRGEVVGIVTLKLTESAGMGFALPSDGSLELVAAIIENGSADGVKSQISSGRPLIGITGVGVEGDTWYENITTATGSAIQPVDESYASLNPENTFYAEISGVYVSMVSEGSDAASKIKKKDIIVKVEGVTVSSIYGIMDIVNAHNGGDALEIEFYREGKYHTVKIVLGVEGE